MRNIFTFFAKRHLLANVLTLALLCLGTWSLFNLNRQEFPNIDTGSVSVTTTYRGASPHDVELNVTNKLEDSLKIVSGIRSLTSTSIENKSSINIEIEEDEDVTKVYNDIMDAVNSTKDLPSDADDPDVHMRDPNKTAMRIGISSEKLTYKEIREYAKQFQKKLLDLPFVATVTPGGYRDREIRIEVSMDKMMAHEISLKDIRDAINSRNIRSSGGSLESYTDQKNVITLSRFTNAEQVKDVILRSNEQGSIVYLKDIADVYDDFVSLTEIHRINGNSTIALTIAKKDSADIIDTVKSIKNFIEIEQKTLPDISFMILRDDSASVKQKFEIVKNNGIIGLILVIFVLAIFLNMRTAFWVSMGIPTSLFGVLILLPVFGVELDSLTMAAMVIVIGIIVDDAIVIVENIYRHFEEGKNAINATIEGTMEVALPVVTTVTTTIIAFIPMFNIDGMLGKFIYVVPLTVILALIVSLLEAFFILPAHILPGLDHNSRLKTESHWFRPVKKNFEGLLKTILEYRYTCIFIAISIMVCSILYSSNYIKFRLFDRNRVVDSIDITITMPIGTSLQATSTKATEFENILKTFPKSEISSFYLVVGRGGRRSDAGKHMAALTLFPATDAKITKPINLIIDDIRKKLDTIGGPQDFRIATTTRGPKSGSPLEVLVKGPDGEKRDMAVAEVMTYLQKMAGISGIELDNKAGKKEIAIKPDYTLLARYGIKAMDLAQTVRLAYDGEIATVTRFGDEDVDFRVIMQKDFRQSLEHLKMLKIPDAQGNLIDLGKIARFYTKPGIFAIYHENGEETVTIAADIDEDQITAIEVLNDVKNKFNFNFMKKYMGIRIDVGGEAEESRAMLHNIIISFILAIAGIYALLMLQFNSITQPLIVMTAIPFGVMGVIFAYGLQGLMHINMFAGVGIIGLIGVVVNDSLVMVDHLNFLGSLKKGKNWIEVIAMGTSNRLRPVLVTTITTVAGLLPLAYGIGGEDSMMSGMAMSMGWGLLFATPITLILLPCLYMVWEDVQNIFNRSKNE